MRVQRLVLGVLDVNCFVIGDDDGGPVVVIDPADDADAVLDAVGDRGVSAIVLTHGHFDHIGAAGQLAERTGAPVLVHRADESMVASPVENLGGLMGVSVTVSQIGGVLDEGDLVSAGDVRLQVLHTPGHTQGGISLLGGGHLFAGDTLFSGSAGRTDFPGGDGRVLRGSLARLAALPAETIVHPGHGPDTTIARERKVNPFFPRA